jgi:hypothetical protein
MSGDDGREFSAIPARLFPERGRPLAARMKPIGSDRHDGADGVTRLPPPRGEAFAEPASTDFRESFSAGFFEGPAHRAHPSGECMTAKFDVPVPMPQDAPVPDVEEGSRRLSRWLSILYVVAALAAPLLLYFGPDVLSPTAPAIANAALDGRFTMRAAVTCKAKDTAARTAPDSRC